MFFALAVFLAVLAAFAAGFVHRTPAALAGAIVLIAAGAIDQEKAVILLSHIR